LLEDFNIEIFYQKIKFYVFVRTKEEEEEKEEKKMFPISITQSHKRETWFSRAFYELFSKEKLKAQFLK
jgi:hypothetical protein